MRDVAGWPAPGDLYPLSCHGSRSCEHPTGGLKAVKKLALVRFIKALNCISNKLDTRSFPQQSESGGTDAILGDDSIDNEFDALAEPEAAAADWGL